MSCLCNCTPCSCATVSVPSLPTCDPFITCGTVCPPVPVTCPEDPQISQFWEPVSTFVVPAVDAGVNVAVKAACQWVVNCCVEIKDETNSIEMRIGSIDLDSNILFLVNIGAPENPAPGTVFTDESKIFFKGICTVILTPEVEEELLTQSFQMIVETLFVVPDVGANSTIILEGKIRLEIGQILFMQGGVCVEVTSNSIQPEVTAVGVVGVHLPPSILPGSTISVGSFVTTAESCVATDDSISGHGTASAPLSVSGLDSIIRCGTEQDITGFTVAGNGYSGENLTNAYDNDENTTAVTIVNALASSTNMFWDLLAPKTGYLFALLDFRKASAAASSVLRGTTSWDDTAWLSDIGTTDNAVETNMLNLHSVTNNFLDKGVMIVPIIGRYVGFTWNGHLRFRMIKMFFEDFEC